MISDEVWELTPNPRRNESQRRTAPSIQRRQRRTFRPRYVHAFPPYAKVQQSLKGLGPRATQHTPGGVAAPCAELSGSNLGAWNGQRERACTFRQPLATWSVVSTAGAALATVAMTR